MLLSVIYGFVQCCRLFLSQNGASDTLPLFGRVGHDEHVGQRLSEIQIAARVLLNNTIVWVICIEAEVLVMFVGDC